MDLFETLEALGLVDDLYVPFNKLTGDLDILRAGLVRANRDGKVPDSLALPLSQLFEAYADVHAALATEAEKESAEV